MLVHEKLESEKIISEFLGFGGNDNGIRFGQDISESHISKGVEKK